MPQDMQPDRRGKAHVGRSGGVDLGGEGRQGPALRLCQIAQCLPEFILQRNTGSVAVQGQRAFGGAMWHLEIPAGFGAPCSAGGTTARRKDGGEMAGIGHNGGPESTGTAWRAHCWRQARERLLPVLPVEVVRLRVRRAAELGLDYKTYAGVRSTTGRDIIAFLFSSNALRVDAAARIPPGVAARLAMISGAGRVGLAQSVGAGALIAVNPGLLDRAHVAPAPYAAFRQTAQALQAALDRLPGDGVVLVASDAPWEAEWLAAGKLAGLIPAQRFFATSA